uniref:Polymerase PB2 n=1 Tax=Coleopteran orthomyxo-related virus OKIAV179 TaxID=2746263 RepID=A0A7D7F8H2_9ORTO|nr:polymerase PB2 [Coleopteran orthomyxo-related virus OKIAV179]
MKDNTMANLKLVERSSKCVKDPNPLSTALSQMNTKYPITLNSDGIKKYNVPLDLIPTNDREDNHSHGRTRCKLEAIDWWIENSGSPSDDAVRVNNILREPLRREASRYFSINWKGSSIKWGQTITERRMVKTFSPLIDIPPNLRESAVKEVMFSEYTLPSMTLSKHTIEKLKEFADLSIESKMSLSRQIRVLLNNMDSKERYLPIVPGISSDLLPLKHVITHTNYVVTNFTVAKRDKSNLMQEPIELFAKCLKVESNYGKLGKDALLDIIRQTTFQNRTIEQILKEDYLNETIEVKWLKILMGISIQNEFTHRNLTISPLQSNCRHIYVTNRGGFRSKVIQGTETVNFKIGSVRGTFTHNSGILMSLTMNYIGYNTLVDTISEVASYIRWNFQSTTKRTEEGVLNEIRATASKSPHLVIKCEKSSLLKIRHNAPSSHGVLNISVSTEYFTFKVTGYVLNRDMEIANPDNNVSIRMGVSMSTLEPLSDMFSIQDTRMLNHFSFKHTIRNRVHHFIINYPELLKRVKRHDFKWSNAYINKFMKPDYRSVSMTCRTLIQGMISQEIENKPVMALLYCFSNHDPMNASMCSVPFQVKGGLKVDPGGKDGIMVYDENTHNYLLFGSKIKHKVTRVEMCDMMTGILSGFRIHSHERKKKKNLVSVRWLETNRDRIEEGKEYSVYISGNLFKVTKDSFFKSQIASTSSRQMEERLSILRGTARNIAIGKRMLYDIDTPDAPVKRSKASVEEDRSPKENYSTDSDAEMQFYDDIPESP